MCAFPSLYSIVLFSMFCTKKFQVMLKIVSKVWVIFLNEFLLVW